MGEILIIRHGETDWNREEVFRGRVDVSLSERGRRQAKLLAESLGASPIEAVYASPLVRARETAAPIAESSGLMVVTEPRFVDMSFGEWEGKERAELEHTLPELYRQWLEHPAQFRAPGGESLSEVMARAWPALEEIANRQAEGLAVVVSHRVVCKLLLCAARGEGEAGFWGIRVDTGSVSAVERVGDRWTVTRVNDTHHLAKLGQGDRVDF